MLIVRGARIDPLDGWGGEEAITEVIEALATADVHATIATVSSPRDFAELRIPRLVALPNSRRFRDDLGRTHCLQELLRRRGIPFVGSGPAGHAARSKLHMKNILTENNLPTPHWKIVHDGDIEDAGTGMRFPVVVKPESGSESVGVTRVADPSVLSAELKTMAARGSLPVIVEEWVHHIEFTVAVIGNGPERQGFPMEVALPPGEGFLSADVKLHMLAQTPVPVTDEHTRHRLADLAIATCVSLQIEDMARVDILGDESGELYVIDVNTLPGLRRAVQHISYFPFCLRYGRGLDYPETILAMVGVALRRYRITMPPAIHAVCQKLLGG
ncbi:MAG: D-alanine--D-alanine ligase family protein [Pseudonocardiaceae bacterium]